MIHSETAQQIRKATGWDLDGFAEARGWDGVAVGPVGRHRESEALDWSNFRVIFADLEARFAGNVDTVKFSHWGVGWIEEIAYDSANTELADRVQEWQDALSCYPVASDDDFHELEWAWNHPTDSECYSDDPECPCR